MRKSLQVACWIYAIASLAAWGVTAVGWQYVYLLKVEPWLSSSERFELNESSSSEDVGTYIEPVIFPVFAEHPDYRLDVRRDRVQAMQVMLAVVDRQPRAPTFRFDVPLDVNNQMDLVMMYTSSENQQEKLRVRFENVSWRLVKREEHQPVAQR